ncbi:Calcium-transporting ATPase 3, endoplasmic reticulum-type [Camellia lanceoleosa]|uniref:Calcium-transporting ATPase 3, endoplasmic reticulum-type n=1 Tax=Camellia lanceoleosa TaxID=1840588 RepID=A0ACC0FDY8_9ERIC|nr:Calcium-transporting ATPase 3, endoplasmic reticulum-type [Camellia lanceoleosa]
MAYHTSHMGGRSILKEARIMKDVPMWKVGESVYNFGRWMPPATIELRPDVYVIPPWSNLWLVGSIVLTMLLHILILYVRPLSILFSVTPLSWAEWTVVFFSFISLAAFCLLLLLICGCISLI